MKKQEKTIETFAYYVKDKIINKHWYGDETKPEFIRVKILSTRMQYYVGEDSNNFANKFALVIHKDGWLDEVPYSALYILEEDS